MEEVLCEKEKTRQPHGRGSPYQRLHCELIIMMHLGSCDPDHVTHEFLSTFNNFGWGFTDFTLCTM